MSRRVTRRVALQWMGGVAVGVVFSPAPYALIDDLTLATQTRGRSTPLPTGALGRTRTRCSACPRACSIEVLTVGGHAYLTVPAPGHGASCVLRPVVHQLALLPQRFDHATLREHGVREKLTARQGLEQAAMWVDEARGAHATIGLVDLSQRPPLATPMQSLAATLPEATWIEVAPHWLDAIGEMIGLDPALELAIDPVQASTALRVGPGNGPSVARDLYGRRSVRALCDRSKASGASGLLFAENGSGTVPERRILERIAAVDLELGAIGTGRLLVPRPRAPQCLSNTVHPLADLEDGSLGLLIVDASRAAGAVAWRRLRRKLNPSTGRMIVFGLGPGPSAHQADLVLPGTAPLEIEEPVGGSRYGAPLRLAVSMPVHAPRMQGVDARDLAARIDDASPAGARGAQALAIGVLRISRGTVLHADGRRESVASLSESNLTTLLRQGAVWEDEPATWIPPAVPPAFHDAAMPHDDSLLMVLEGAPVLAAGEAAPAALSKVGYEHPLVARSGYARAHPLDLDRHHAREGAHCRLRTVAGDLDVIVRADAAVQRGHVLVGAGLRTAEREPAAAPLEREPLELLDFDPRQDGPLAIRALEVL